MDVQKYSKALVPLAVAVVVAVVSKLGITPGMTIQDAISLIITSGLVYFVPNKPTQV